MNLVYNKFLYRLMHHDINVATAVFKMIFFRETSTYTPSAADATVADIISGGAVEVTAASYSRQTIGSQTVTEDDSGNRAVFGGANVAEGNLEQGQAVGQILIYEHTGSSDATNYPCIFFDGKTKVTLVAPATHPGTPSTSITAITAASPGNVTSASHGLTTGDVVMLRGVVGMTQVNNLEFTVTVIDSGHFTIGVDTSGYTAYASGGSVCKTTTIYVKPLEFDLLQGSAVTFNGTATGYVSNAAARNDTSLRIAALSASLTLPDYVAAAQTTLVLPLSFGGGAFNVNFTSGEIMELVNRV